MKNYIHIFAKWLEKKAHEVRVKRIFKKYGPSPELGGNWFLMTEERLRKAYLEAYIDIGDIRFLMDYFGFLNRDYRYYEKAFRKALVETVFKDYDVVRYKLVEFWYDILCTEEKNDYQDAMIKKYFGKNRKEDVK